MPELGPHFLLCDLNIYSPVSILLLINSSYLIFIVTHAIFFTYLLDFHKRKFTNINMVLGDTLKTVSKISVV